MAKLTEFELITHSPAETQRLGERIGKLALPGDIFLLSGNLGTGKTCLTQGIARGLGIKEHVASPSFTLIKELYGRLPMYHIDLYRLERPQEVQELGMEEYLHGEGVCVIEWAERILEQLPVGHEHLMIKIDYVPKYDNERVVSFKPVGQRYHQILQALLDFWALEVKSKTA